MILFFSKYTQQANAIGKKMIFLIQKKKYSIDSCFTYFQILILGAPMWTDYSSMGKFETGRVYVVYQSKEV